jgi:hypothetical protein
MKLSKCPFQNITAIVGILGMIFWGTSGYLWGTHFERKRWEKATAEVVWHCIHTGPSRPLNSNPGTNEKAAMPKPGQCAYFCPTCQNKTEWKACSVCDDNGQWWPNGACRVVKDQKASIVPTEEDRLQGEAKTIDKCSPAVTGSGNEIVVNCK